MAMKNLFPGFSFPTRGWKQAGSDSYGASELFHGIRHVLVRIFPALEEQSAYGTHHFLKELGVTTATIDKVSHVDGSEHYYVWGERDEVMTRTEGHVPALSVEGRL